MNSYTDILALYSQLRRLAMKPDPACEWLIPYWRFSSPEQEQGDSIRRQETSLESWLSRHPNVKVDRSMKAWDKRAVSAFTADHRINPKYVLAQFEIRVDRKDIRPGTYLAVENLDRLTREHWKDAVPYVLSLISKGIRILQLMPTEIVYDSNMDQGRLMLMLMELGRAHSESKVKSERVREACGQKRQAAQGGKPHGWRVPAWIESVDGEYRVKPGAADTVSQIFRLSAAGLGGTAIVRHLNNNSFAPLIGSTWKRSYVCKILAGREVLGEWQPQAGRQDGRRPLGEPIPNYFPAVVTEADYYASKSAQTARAGKCGRPGKRGVATSPFSGLLRCANDGGKLHTSTQHARRVLVSAAAKEADDGSRWVGFPLDHLTDAVLSRLREITSTALFDDPGAPVVEALKAKQRAIADRLATATARWEADPLSQAWQEQVTKWDREHRTIGEQLREAVRQAAHPASATWSEAIQLMRQNDPVRLRQCLLETITAVWVLIVPKNRSRRLAAVQVKFHGGAERQYLIRSTTPIGVQCRTLKRDWVCYDLGEKVPGGFDLSDRKQSAKLARLLEKLNLDSF